MLDEGIDLLEGSRIEQKFDSLSRGELSLLVLLLDSGLASSENRLSSLLIDALLDGNRRRREVLCSIDYYFPNAAIRPEGLEDLKRGQADDQR